jgi:hypothetical protein
MKEIRRCRPSGLFIFFALASLVLFWQVATDLYTSHLWQSTHVDVLPGTVFRSHQPLKFTYIVNGSSYQGELELGSSFIKQFSLERLVFVNPRSPAQYRWVAHSDAPRMLGLFMCLGLAITFGRIDYARSMRSSRPSAS